MTKNLAKVLDSNPEYFSPDNLAKTTSAFLKSTIFNNMDFALLDERARIISEIGVVLSNYYHGSFIEYLEKADWDAVKLVRQIAMDFTGFRDEAIFNGE